MAELVVVITHEADLADNIVSAWIEQGVQWWASFDARTPIVGKERRPQVDMPLIPSLRGLLAPDMVAGRVLLCMVSGEQEKTAAMGAVTDVAGDPTLRGRGVLFTVQLGSVLGLPQ